MHGCTGHILYFFPVLSFLFFSFPFLSGINVCIPRSVLQVLKQSHHWSSPSPILLPVGLPCSSSPSLPVHTKPIAEHHILL